ncbi:MAG: helix-turn-helix transcriptional regulator [Frankia sp.]|nr:helix-turn-helix transcriptional regulator [Frankia sp.]
MAPSLAVLRAQSADLRAAGWSYRRIAEHWQAVHGLNARLAFRLAHGWTQEEAARRWNERWPDAPKTGKAFSYWETWPAPGGRAPSPTTLSRLAELYRCRPGDLLGGTDHGAGDDPPPAPAQAPPGRKGRCTAPCADLLAVWAAVAGQPVGADAPVGDPGGPLAALDWWDDGPAPVPPARPVAGELDLGLGFGQEWWHEEETEQAGAA